MDWKQIEKQLPEGVRKALTYLGASGFDVILETKIEDGRTIEGKRRRTFKVQGRYNVVAALRSIECVTDEGVFCDDAISEQNTELAQAMDDAGVKFAEMEARIKDLVSIQADTELWAAAVGDELHKVEARANALETALADAAKPPKAAKKKAAKKDKA